MSHFRIIFIIATFIISMIVTVQIRVINHHNFYKLRTTMVEQARLKQSLYQKKIKLEKLTNVDSVVVHIKDSEVDDEN